jgi:hypothetical protein
VGKISVKVDSASNGKNSNPKIDEMYLIKNGFKAGKQALKFGISDTNFNTLHSSTEKSQSMSGIGLSFTGETKKINYTLFVGKDTLKQFFSTKLTRLSVFPRSAKR